MKAYMSTSDIDINYDVLNLLTLACFATSNLAYCHCYTKILYLNVVSIGEIRFWYDSDDMSNLFRALTVVN